jgi:outer membrane lipase/esterase
MSLKSKKIALTKCAMRTLPALVASALLLGTGAAQAVQFQGVYVFGDSLSDSGYFRPFLTQVVGAQSAAVLGRFTNNPGPVWAELIAQNYGGNANPANAGGQNYAQGGARIASSSTSTPPGSAQRPVSTQITEYLASTGGSANPNGLYSVWIGANDIFQTLPLIQTGQVNASTFLAQSAGATVQQVARLQAAGARYVLLFNLPDIGTTPAFTLPALGGSAALAAAGTSLSAGYNINLFNAVAANGLRVIPVDTFSLISEVRANAAAFGFTNITSPACNLAATQGSSQFCTNASLVPGATGNNYVFADGVHPTSGAHAILADHIKSLIDGPNAYSTMAEVPLSSRAAHVRTLDSGLTQGANAAIGKVSVFAAYDGGKFDISTSNLNPQTNTKNRAGTIGATARVSESVTLGLAIGTGNSEARMLNGQYDIDDTSFSLFAAAKAGGLYGNFTATASDLRFKNIRRTIKLGQVTRVNSADTKGSNGSASLMFGYDWRFGGVEVGPFLSFTQQRVAVNGFQENANAAQATTSDLKISSQDRQSRVSSFGLRASVKVGSFTPFIRVSADTEENNQDRFVTASPVTVTQGILYDIPGYKGDKRWMTGTIGVRGNITPQIGLGLVYTSVSSKEGIKQDGVTANVNFAF